MECIMVCFQPCIYIQWLHHSVMSFYCQRSTKVGINCRFWTISVSGTPPSKKGRVGNRSGLKAAVYLYLQTKSSLSRNNWNAGSQTKSWDINIRIKHTCDWSSWPIILNFRFCKSLLVAYGMKITYVQVTHFCVTYFVTKGHMLQY